MRFLFLFLTVSLPIWTTPAPVRAELFDPETFTLDNGLQVVVLTNPRAPIVTHMVWYKVGAADELPGESGLAHFLEHLMFKGTETMEPGEFSQIVARIGGEENAFTSQDYTAYYQSVAAEELETVMRLEADRMANLVFSDELVTPEREVILEERRSRIDSNPSSLLGVMVDAALYLNSPYRIPIIGWEHEIRELTTEDLSKFYRRWYAPNNAVLIVAGDVTVGEVRSLAEKYYGTIKPRPVPERSRPQEPTQSAPRRVVLEDPRVGQPAVTIQYLAPSYTTADDGEAYALDVMNEIMGGGTTSRLYRTLVVEQGLAAAAGSFYSPDALDLTTFGFYVSPRPGIEPEAAEAGLRAEIARLLEKGVTEEEVRKARDRLRASVAYARDDLSTGARIIGAALSTGQTVSEVEGWPERIADVTVEQVNAAARSVLQDRQSVTGVLLPKPVS